MTRREREAAEKAALGKLTSPEKAAIRRWVRTRVPVGERTDALAELLEWTTINGWDAFVARRAFVKQTGGDPVWRIEPPKAIWRPSRWKPAT